MGTSRTLGRHKPRAQSAVKRRFPGEEASRPRSASLPAWLIRALEEPPPPGVRLEGGILLSVSIGQDPRSRWFTNLPFAQRHLLLQSLIDWIEVAAPGTPKLYHTQAGFLRLRAWIGRRALRRLVEPFSRWVPRHVSCVLGIDGPYSAALNCAQVQTLLGVYRGTMHGPVMKFFPAPTDIGHEHLLDVARTWQYRRRCLPTPWGDAYAAVCHDLFPLAGLAQGYRARVAGCPGAPSREDLEQELPSATNPARHPHFVLNAIHAFTRDRDGRRHYGRFPTLTRRAAMNVGVPVLSAAGFTGIEHTNWCAARLPDGTVPSTRERRTHRDVDWSAGEGQDWVWIQGYWPATLGLAADPITR